MKNIIWFVYNFSDILLWLLVFIVVKNYEKNFKQLLGYYILKNSKGIML